MFLVGKPIGRKHEKTKDGLVFDGIRPDFVRFDPDLHRLPVPIIHVENPIPRAALGRFLSENAYSRPFALSLGRFWVLSS